MQSADCVPCSLQTAYLAPCSLQTAQVLRLHATAIVSLIAYYSIKVTCNKNKKLWIVLTILLQVVLSVKRDKGYLFEHSLSSYMLCCTPVYLQRLPAPSVELHSTGGWNDSAVHSRLGYRSAVWSSANTPGWTSC